MTPVELLTRMLEIPSPSGDERRLAEFLAGAMADLGFRTSIDAVGNVLGEVGAASRPRVLLLGHLDTIAGDLRVRLEDGRLHGRGAVDAKGPLAAMICAAAAAADLPARLVVVGAVEEERPESTGARHLLRSEPVPDAIVIGEPTGVHGVGIGYRGRVGVHYQVRRPGSHSSSPTEKAVELAVQFWLRVRDHLAAMPPGAGMFDSAAATLTRLEGDLRRAHADITCRVPIGFDFDAFEAYLDAARGDARVQVDERTPAVRSDRSDPVVRALTAAIREHGGRPSLKLKSGTSDMNVVGEAWRVPIAAYGPGASALDHTDEEHQVVDEYLHAIDVLRGALAGIAAARAEPAPADDGLSDVEEAAVTARLRSLGYLE
ncbi:MAG TPA: M20/M25/M40 family metallo-hydrolase [Candidatus Dormibacteraeota bacterium]|nr:M20/M25/M40 family metallo-hydrolase [Candidatus Dormibacteraeota bacterium]